MAVWPCGVSVSREGCLGNFFMLVITWNTFTVFKSFSPSLSFFFFFLVLNPNFWLFLLAELLTAESLHQRIYEFKDSLHMWLPPHCSWPTLSTIFYFLWFLLLFWVKILTFQLQIAYVWALRKLNIFSCLLAIGLFFFFVKKYPFMCFVYFSLVTYCLSLHLNGLSYFLKTLQVFFWEIKPIVTWKCFA